MNKGYIYAGLLISLCLLTSLIISYQTPQTIEQTAVENAMTFRNTITMVIVRDGKEIYHETTANLITQGGRDWVEEQFVNASRMPEFAAKYIALSNSSTQAQTDTDLIGKISCCNLSIENGTLESYLSIGYGNFSLQKTWYSTGSVNNVQAAGIFTQRLNATTNNTLVAEGTFTPTTNIANRDELTLIYNITIS